MVLPKWALKSHPVVQRELAVWGRYRVAFRLFYAGFGAMCVMSLISDLMTIFAPDAFGYLFLFIQSLPGAVAVLAFKGLLLAMSALSIPRDRESQSWDALRLTGLRPVELLAGRTAAVVRLVWFPILCWMALNVTLTSAFLFRRLFETRFRDLDSVPRFLFFLAFDAVTPCAVVTFYLALGLLLSTLASTQAKALMASMAILGLLVVSGWVGDWIDLHFNLSFALGSVAATLLEFGWASGLAFAFYKFAEWRVARNMKPVY